MIKTLAFQDIIMFIQPSENLYLITLEDDMMLSSVIKDVNQQSSMSLHSF